MAQPVSQAVTVFCGDSFDFVFRILDVVEADFLSADFDLRLRGLAKDSQGQTELRKRTKDGTLSRSMDGTTGVLRVRLWPEETDRVPIGSIATFRFIKANEDRGQRTYVTGRLVGVTDPGASSGDVGVDLAVSVGETVIEISVSDLAGVALSGKANTDGANVSAAAFLAALSGAKNDLTNIANPPTALTTIGVQHIVPEHYGAVAGPSGDPATNATAITAALAAGESLGVPVRFSRRRLYRVAQIALSGVIAGSCCLQPITPVANPLNPVDVTVENLTFENLRIDLTEQAQNANATSVVFKGGVKGTGDFDFVASVQRNATCRFDSGDIDLERVTGRRINRPFVHQALWITDNTQALAWLSGIRIGRLLVRSYIRGLRLAGVRDGIIESYSAAGRAAGGTKEPGNNALFVSGVQDFRLPNMDLRDAPEHAIRYGGSFNSFFSTARIAIGQLVVANSGGCAMKSNTGLVLGSGVVETADDCSIASITGYNIGEEPTSSNEELLRLSNTRGWSIGRAVALKGGGASSCFGLLKASNTRGLTIDSLEGEAVKSYPITLTTTGDYPGQEPDIRDVTIKSLKASVIDSIQNAIKIDLRPTTGHTGPGEIDCPAGKIANFNILGGVVAGLSTRLADWNAATILDGPINIKLRIEGGKPGNISGIPADARVNLDVEMLAADGASRTTYRGQASLYAPRLQVTPPLVLASGVASAALTGATTETQMGVITVPGGALGPNGFVRVTALWSAGANNANAKNCRIRAPGSGGTPFRNVDLANNTHVREMVIIQNAGSETTQKSRPAASNEFGTGTGTIISTTINTAADWNINLTGQLANAADSLTLEGWIAEVFYVP